MLLNTIHETLKQGAETRVFVIGDVHGNPRIIEDAMESVGFNTEKDLMISVGDLVDVGPDSAQCLMYLREDWFVATRGNHEHLIKMYMDRNEDETLIDALKDNGAQWFLDLPFEQKEVVHAMVKRMPVALTVEMATGHKIGVVHADCPNDDWNVFLERLDERHHKQLIDTLWTRNRYESKSEARVKNINAIVVGHNPIGVNKFNETLGNVVHIDTGRHFDDSRPLPIINLDWIEEQAGIEFGERLCEINEVPDFSFYAEPVVTC